MEYATGPRSHSKYQGRMGFGIPSPNLTDRPQYKWKYPEDVPLQINQREKIATTTLQKKL